jgi:hypothetical protein
LNEAKYWEPKYESELLEAKESIKSLVAAIQDAKWHIQYGDTWTFDKLDEAVAKARKVIK